MAATRWNQRRQRNGLGGWGGALSVGIGFGNTTYSEAGQEPSIATIGGATADSMASSICSGAADSVAASICDGAVDLVAAMR
jgi:hypothetical protein